MSGMVQGIYHVSFNISRTRTLLVIRPPQRWDQGTVWPGIQIYYDILETFRRQLDEEESVVGT